MFEGNRSSVSDSMRDNPFLQYYASIYALSMAVMLILKAIRGVVFVKVSQWAGLRCTPPQGTWELGVACARVSAYVRAVGWTLIVTHDF